MPGPPPKPADRRQWRGGPKTVTIPKGNRVVHVPEPPDGLQERTVEQWESYWCSDVAQVVERRSDMAGVRRLFQLYDERDRAYQGYRGERLVEGSQGQPVINPLAKVMQNLDSEIRQLEDRFGLNPKARLQLGIHMTEARKGLSALMDGLDPYADSDDDDSDEAATLAAV